ncbi:MAG: response regulator receiver domain [Caulobacteraceae bacterium]
MTVYANFEDLQLSAAKAFVRTAILIDNEPRTEVRASAPEVAKKATSGAAPDFGAKPAPPPAQRAEAVTGEAVKSAPDDAAAPGLGDHQLAVRPVTNAFSAEKITCGFYFPSAEDADLVDVAHAAARHVDATIIDWQLRDKDTGPAKDLITRLIQEDRTEGGRLRLIVVYTGERGLDAECGKLQEHLRTAGIDGFNVDDQGRALLASNTLITFANKPAPAKHVPEPEGPGVRPIPWEELPQFVLKSYARLSQGLLQAFALNSIGAVRDDTHHLLSLFPPSMDAAFLAQRAGIGDPADAEELMTTLLVSEFAASIGDRGIPLRSLGGDAAVFRVEARPQPKAINVKEYKEEPIYKDIIQVPKNGAKHILADQATLKSLVRIGLDSALIGFKEDQRKGLDLQFFSTDADGQRELSSFARLSTFTREAASSRRIGREKIVLTGGVIVRSVKPGEGDAPEIETYMLCVQPGCDAVRLKGTVAFPFCPMALNSSVFDLILNPDAGKANKFFKVDRRPRSLKLLDFPANDESQSVLTEKREGLLGFAAVDGTFWEFVAELRPLEAQHFTTLLVGKFNRVALNSSEWLRLHRGE